MNSIRKQVSNYINRLNWLEDQFKVKRNSPLINTALAEASLHDSLLYEQIKYLINDAELSSDELDQIFEKSGIEGIINVAQNRMNENKEEV